MQSGAVRLLGATEGVPCTGRERSQSAEPEEGPWCGRWGWLGTWAHCVQGSPLCPEGPGKPCCVSSNQLSGQNRLAALGSSAWEVA